MHFKDLHITQMKLNLLLMLRCSCFFVVFFASLLQYPIRGQSCICRNSAFKSVDRSWSFSCSLSRCVGTSRGITACLQTTLNLQSSRNSRWSRNKLAECSMFNIPLASWSISRRYHPNGELCHRQQTVSLTSRKYYTVCALSFPLIRQ